MKKMLLFGLCFIFVFCTFGCGNGYTTVENMDCTITIRDWDETGLKPTEEYEVTGTYTGDIVNGVPNGYGRFDFENEISLYYEGEFVDGTFQGQGTMDSDLEESKEEDEMIESKGTYTKGLYTPTLSEFYCLFPKFHLNNYSLNEVSVDFIDSHETLFPCKSEEDINNSISLTNNSITYNQLIKNIFPYLDKLFTANELTVVQIFEDNSVGYTCTTILNHDNNGKFYYTFYNGTVDLYEGDKFNMRALPLAYSDFDNVSNGQTLVVVALASIIDKL